ncbi:hypothetical protein CSIM01_12833 [Colletotrichum simmondsii]|uniref:Uncharacterized protein n=1 Tax=Colletotrichum simmondsii TaxID=703756 RepID=A0A135SFU4_9PEZI|nr:hypothetical protein CSIM01_12833 [Colletotrichum simmondsii]
MKIYSLLPAALLSGAMAAPAPMEDQIAKVPARISRQTLYNIRKACPTCTITATHVLRSNSDPNCFEINDCCSAKAPIRCYEDGKFNVAQKSTPKRDLQPTSKIQKRQCHPCCTDGDAWPEEKRGRWWGCKNVPGLDCRKCMEPPEWEWIIPGGVNEKEREDTGDLP